MLLSGKLSVIATGLVFLPAVIGAQCAATLNTAVSVATRLQSHYYNSANGQYNGGSLWTDAVLTISFFVHSSVTNTDIGVEYLGRYPQPDACDWD
jgi:hypothetical protein